jgi:hypothetical protein
MLVSARTGGRLGCERVSGRELLATLYIEVIADNEKREYGSSVDPGE